MCRDNNLGIDLREVGGEFYLSKGYSKVIFSIVPLDFEDETLFDLILKLGEIQEYEIVFLKNKVEKSCSQEEFADCFKVTCDYLFSKDENLKKIVTPRHWAFSKDLFANDEFDLQGSYIIKTKELEKRMS